MWSKLVGPLAVEAGGRQHGAVPQGGTEFPSHACRLFLKEAARTRRPAAVLFTDLASAFYSALPELALGAISTSQKRAQVFDALDIAHEQRVRLEELIRSEDTVIKRQEVAECWRKMAVDFHKEPWFWVSGSRIQVHTFVGTRPGDPLVDVVFALTFLAFQNSLEQFLGQVEATINVPRRCGWIFGTGEVVQETVPCPTYMDDLTILMEADPYESLLVKMATVTKGTFRIASDFGFQLNLALGKTEAVVSWVGPGSRPIRRRLMALSNNGQVAMLPLYTRLDDVGDVQFPALAENDRAVRNLQSYRHIGTIVQTGAGMANAGQATTHTLARRLLGNEGLPRHVRVQVANACVGFEMSAPSRNVGRIARPPAAAFEGGLEQTMAHHCWGPSAAAPGTVLEVQ